MKVRKDNGTWYATASDCEGSGDTRREAIAEALAMRRENAAQAAADGEEEAQIDDALSRW